MTQFCAARNLVCSFVDRTQRLLLISVSIAVGALALASCRSEAGSPPVPTVAAVPSSSTIQTTAPATTPSSVATTGPDVTVSSLPPVAVIVPTRSEGIRSLDLTAADLDGVAVLEPSVIGLLPHDQSAFTEALDFSENGDLLESVGLHGRSNRRILDATDGALLAEVEVRPELFATGLADLGGTRGAQFTSLQEVVGLFDTETLVLSEERAFPFEVSGVCDPPAASDSIVISHPDASVSIIDLATLEVEQALEPHAGSTPLPALTDLHCNDNSIWGILESTGVLVEIDAATGELKSIADLASLTPAGLASTDVLSAVAFRESSDTWFVTGKRWDVLYELSLDP